MSPGEIMTAIGGFCAVVVGFFTARHVNRSAQETTTDTPGATAWRTLASMDDRLTAAEKRVESLEADLNHERTHSRGQDEAIKALEQQMVRAVKHIRDFWRWIDGGAKPPPPARPDWLTGLPGWNSDDKRGQP